MRKENKMVHFKAKDKEDIQFPFYLIEGEEEGPTICITAGIHGCEYSSIIASIRLYKYLDPKAVKGNIKIIPIVNLPAFKNKNMFICPIDNKNLNGLFPGRKNGSYSEQLVFKLCEEFIEGSDYYLDLHGGDLVEEVIPFAYVHQSNNEAVNQKSKELAENYGTENILFTTLNGDTYQDNGFTFSYAAENGIPAIQTERGGIGQVKEKDVLSHMNGLLNVLKFIGCLEGISTKNNKINYFNKYGYVHSEHEGIFYLQRKIGEQINKGDILGNIEDYLGNKIEVVKSPYTGKIAMLNTSPAVKRKGVLFGIVFDQIH